jgi:hypothetical protein
MMAGALQKESAMSYLRFAAITVCTCVIVLLFTTFVYAQSDYGSITGFVKDPSGAVVPKSKVTFKNEGNNEERSSITNEAGYFVMPNLQPGYYTVTAEAAGFKKFVSPHNKLNPNTTLSLDASLTIGSAAETVEVSATNEALQTESGAVQNGVSSQQVDYQELNGRNPIYIAQLLPGVRGGGTLGDFNFASTGGMSWQINGARTWDSLVTFDGAPAVRTRSNGAVIGVADVGTTQEIQVMTADYAAEYGRAAGGQLRIITKSGTKDFHGSAYEYFRNSDLNSNTWTRNLSSATNFASPFRYNNFGFTVGGPIWIPQMGSKYREKFFFFVGEDWIRYRATDTQTQAVPTTLMAQGNFRVAEPQPLVQNRNRRVRSEDLSQPRRIVVRAVPQQHHSNHTLEPQWGGDPFRLPAAHSRLSGRHTKLGSAGRPPLQPAQGNSQHRHPGHGQTTHLGTALGGVLF